MRLIIHTDDIFAELHKINSPDCTAPGDKIKCVQKCCELVFGLLSDGGADDFLPIFICIVLNAGVEKLYLNCQYITNFHRKATSGKVKIEIR